MPADAVTLTARVVENTKKHHAGVGVEAQVLIAAASSAASGFLFLGGSVTGNARWWGWKRAGVKHNSCRAPSDVEGATGQNRDSTNKHRSSLSSPLLCSPETRRQCSKPELLMLAFSRR